MPNPFKRRQWLGLTCLLALGAGSCDNQPEDATAPELGRFPNARRAPATFSVYTQNMYLGGDTGPLFMLDFDDPAQVPAIIGAVNVFWGEVQNSDIPERVAEVVDEIGRRMPLVVGLQEVLRFVVLENGAPTTGIDMLAILQAEIQARGLPYVTEVVQPTTSSGLPLGLDLSTSPPTPNPVLAFTDHQVLLRRDDTQLLDEAQGLYDVAATFGPVRVDRGWGRVTIDYRGTPHHVVSTHLEVQAIAPVQAAQASQLMNEVLAGLDGVTVLVGDLNSDAEASPGDPSWTPTYGDLIEAGFTDVWDRSPTSRRSDGFTCCQDPVLRNPTSELDQRIDFVLIRPSSPRFASRGRLPGVFFSQVLGEEPGDLTPSGLWPSDHAGVTARFRLPRGVLRSFTRTDDDDEGGDG